METKTYATNKYVTRESMKYFAMLTMTLNHIAHYWEIGGILGNLMIGIGYFTGPCMCYLLVEGFYHTRSVSAYMRRLLMFALLSQLPFNMLNSGDWLILEYFNMMLSLAMCLGICIVYESDRMSYERKKIIFVCILLFSNFCDWNYIAPILIYTILRMRDGSMSHRTGYLWQWGFFLVTMLLNAYDTASTELAASGTTDVRILGYTGIYTLCYLAGPCLVTWCLKHRDTERPVKKGSWCKWFFYCYYPVHMLMLILVKYYGIV